MAYKQEPFTPDIPGAIVVPAHVNNVRPGDNHPKVNVFHTPEEKADEIEVTPSYFARNLLLADPPRRASTHNYISGGRGTLGDGELYQMVPEKYGAIANGVIGKPYPADTDPNISLNLQSRSVELEGYAATIHLTMPRGCKQWNRAVLWTVAGYRLYGIPLDRAHNIGHREVANNRGDPGNLDIDAIVEDARTLLGEIEEEEKMVKLLRLGADDDHGGLKWTAFTYVTDGFEKRHITNPEALKELQDAGIWPSGDIPLVSRAALEELAGDL
jgi:hypothetical protein